MPAPTSSAISRFTRGRRSAFRKREKLIGVLVDAGPERRLEQVAVGSRRGVPAQSAQIGGEDARVVGPELRDARPSLVGQNLGVEFGVPKDRDGFALGVVVDAGQAKCVQPVDRRPVLDEPTARSNANEITRVAVNSSHAPPRSIFLLPRALDQTGTICAIGSTTGRVVSDVGRSERGCVNVAANHEPRPQPSPQTGRDYSGPDTTTDASPRYPATSFQMVRMR